MSKFSTTSSAQEVHKNSEEEVDLREIFLKYWKYWKWFVVSLLIFLSLGVLFYMIIDRKYDIQAAILLKEDNGAKGGVSSNSPLGGLQDLGLLGTTNNIDNEIAILSSPNLMRQVVTELELNVSYFEKGFFRNTEIYNQSPYYIKLADIDPLIFNGEIKVEIKQKNSIYSISGIYYSKEKEYLFDDKTEELPAFIQLPENLGRLYVSRRPNTELDDETYLINIINTQKAAYNLTEMITISSTTKKSSVLNISLNTLNIEKGVAIINKIIDIYNKNNVADNSESSKRTSDFIDTRLIDISKELGDVEGKVVEYKTKEGIANISAESKNFIEQTSKIQEARIELITQIKTLELVKSFLDDSGNNFKLISTLGIKDPGLVNIITNYNNQLINYERLNNSTSTENPTRQRAENELENVRESIKKSILDVNESLNISTNELDKQIAGISSRIHSVPRQEKELIEILRQQEIKQALFIFLMKVKEETNITMASTFDKAKIITDPIEPEFPRSPKKSFIFIAFSILGLAVPIGVIFISEKLKTHISDSEELERLSEVSVIGEIIKKADSDPELVVKANSDSSIIELFRALRNNIKFILNSSNKKVILITSTIPGEGKTFISSNLAASFALSDKKVLIIGADIRSPQLAKDFHIKRSAGLTSYLSGEIENWRSLLMINKELPNLDILQAGAIPPNPNELLMKKEFATLIDSAKKEYDIIIIDSAPVGVISDTFIFGHLADITTYVTRENVTPKEAVKFINSLKEEEKLPSMYLVLNGVDIKNRKNRYGYGRGYEYDNNKK